MATQAEDTNEGSNVWENSDRKKSVISGESLPIDMQDIFEIPKNSTTEPFSSDDEGSYRTVSSTEQKRKSTILSTTLSNVKSSKSNAPKLSTMKSLVNDVREMKDRIRKLEEEVFTLHELLKVQDDITAETLELLPDSLKDTNRNSWNKHSIPPLIDYRHQKHDYHKHDKDSGSSNNPVSQAMMMNNHAWYGDAFLYELLCQYKGYHPKEDNWFSSVYSFVAFEAFCKRMFYRKSFYRSCILCIGYSDLFNAKAVTGYPMKQTLHALLNYMHEHGAQLIKVLSIPPARQMMKNVEYLKICQTTNKFMKAITKTHTFVDFINLDKFFVNNANDSFNYIEASNEVLIQIRDQLLMRKVNDHFEIFIDPETAKEVIEHVVEPKGYQNSNSSNGSYSNKRRAESVSSSDYPAKRGHKPRPKDDYDEDYNYRSNNCDSRYNDYKPDNSHTDEEYRDDYDYRPRRSNSRSERNSPPPWLKR